MGKPVNYGFPPIVNRQSRRLVLGSMPGIESLRQRQYYAHPRNAFWPIMAEICDFAVAMPYPQRCQQLLQSSIAVWDVIKACHRPGSLDQSIDNSTIKANDFAGFLQQYSNIQQIYFNGGKAEQLFNKLVLPQLENKAVYQFQRLPSTSPAHAILSLQDKKCSWKAAINKNIPK